MCLGSRVILWTALYSNTFSCSQNLQTSQVNDFSPTELSARETSESWMLIAMLLIDCDVSSWANWESLRIFHDFPRERLWVDHQTRSIKIFESMCSSHRAVSLILFTSPNFSLGEGNILSLAKIISSLIYRCTSLIRHSRNTNIIENFCLSSSFIKYIAFKDACVYGH